jgi:hypothetical protein
VPQVDIICLANSRKHGGRCVAGLRVDGSGWLRPVGTLPDGTLLPANFTLDNGTQAAVLDVIRVGVLASRPAPHQPENWLIDGKTWELVARPMGRDLIPVLQRATVCGPELLGGFPDRLPFSDFQQHRAAASVAIVAPESIELHPHSTSRGKVQGRGRFSLGPSRRTHVYDLPITDPRWEGVASQLQQPCTLQQAKNKFVLTISLGEPFDGYCYKLIAAIILLPLSIASGL